MGLVWYWKNSALYAISQAGLLSSPKTYFFTPFSCYHRIRFHFLQQKAKRHSKMCNELIRCGCKHDKGCQGRCKCIEASLPCTALCNCGGDCKSWLFFIIIPCFTENSLKISLNRSYLDFFRFFGGIRFCTVNHAGQARNYICS